MGLELQLEELNEQRERARVQRRADDVVRLEREIEALQAELAMTAEYLAMEGAAPEPEPQLQHAQELRAVE